MAFAHASELISSRSAAVTTLFGEREYFKGSVAATLPTVLDEPGIAAACVWLIASKELLEARGYGAQALTGMG